MADDLRMALAEVLRKAGGLTPSWWTFLMRRAETRENVHDDCASETLLDARVQSAHR